MKNKKNQEVGQSVLEYLIVSSLIGVFCLVAISEMGKVMKQKIRDMKTHINQTIKIK